MERKKVSLNELEKVLSPKEMKNVLGGSIVCHSSGTGASYCVGGNCAPKSQPCYHVDDCKVCY